MPFCAYCGSQVAETSYRPCPACGNATNGAPRTQLGTGGRNAVVIVIVAIVVGVLAIPLIGILAAIAIPNVLTAQQRSKQIRTLVEIRNAAQQAETHATAHGAYPKTLDDPARDGWNNPLRYECLETDGKCAGFGITSAGKDGRFENRSAAEYAQGATERFDCDIVYANGSFVQYPQGVAK
ncbi:MAG TPA: type II secretion system protein [Thermoanaerobaculia bacterium]|nr:type II secretion system protein [Thermoanaerobaculia bacterium]